MILEGDSSNMDQLGEQDGDDDDDDCNNYWGKLSSDEEDLQDESVDQTKVRSQSEVKGPTIPDTSAKQTAGGKMKRK